MKKVILIIWIIFLLTSCYSKTEDTKKIEHLENKISELENNKKLETNILCWEKKVEYIKEQEKEWWKNLKRTFWDTWFSPILNTCILESDFYSLEPIRDWDNYNWFYLIDTLKKEVIWSLEYYEQFWFEWWAYLPKKCDFDFNNIKEVEEKINLIRWAVSKWEIWQEIYNSEFDYINCKNFLKWNKKKIEIKINDIDLKYDYKSFKHIRF